MLKEILSISGKPGLYKLVSQAKGMFVVESLVTGKRMPAYTNDKIIAAVKDGHWEAQQRAGG